MEQRNTSAQELSTQAKSQLEALRGRGLSFHQIAAQVPVSVATVWKATAGGKMSRPVRLLLESRLRELTAAIVPVGLEAAE